VNVFRLLHIAPRGRVRLDMFPRDLDQLKKEFFS
jgi:hypothetical protein